MSKTNKKTYPIPKLMQNFEYIKEVYEMLNEHVKLGISIHPAGEWILDNFYILEETVKTIKQELTFKKYINFVGIKDGEYSGFARVYALAIEIVNYTDCRIRLEDLEKYLKEYQTKETLNMDEIWNIGIFIQIAIIQNIKQICEKIYLSQIEKFKVEKIIENIMENRRNNRFKLYILYKNDKKFIDMKYPFIEYMSYKLKKYGKKTEKYLEALEEIVQKAGSSVSEVIKKEHYDIALSRVLVGNAILSIKEIQRINFLDIFEKINGVEEILKSDPAGVYEKMDQKSKDYYRQEIKKIAKRAKISEIYVAKQLLDLAINGKGKKSHIGYYLFGENKNIIFKKIGFKVKKIWSEKQKAKYYITMICIFTILLSFTLVFPLTSKVHAIWNILSFVLLLIPSSEVVIQIIQYLLNKIVKPKIIPKIDLYNRIDEENKTIVVIPTILRSKEKVKELMKKLEVFYLANKSDNLYFCLLGDSTESTKQVEKFDKDITDEGTKQAEKLNKKYSKDIFHFAYRKRKWNDKQRKYLGWERKRGALTEFVEVLLGNMNEKEINERYYINTFYELIKRGQFTNEYSEKEKSIKEKLMGKIKYLITLDSDTDLNLNTAFELVGTMSHILNKPEFLDGKVVSGHALIQPRVGVNLDISYKNIFTKIFAGSGGIDSYTNAISDTYQDNFDEGIFTGKGIFNIEAYSKVLKKEIPENTVLSHDLLEGNYLRCGLATDIMLMDGYPTKYSSFMARLSRWIRGDIQIIKWLKSSKMNTISKFKIFDNLRRSLFEIFVVINAIYFFILAQIYNLNIAGIKIFLGITVIFPFLLEIANRVIFKKEGEHRQDSFTPKIGGILGAICRAILTLGCLPYKAYISLKSITVSIYRMYYSKRNLLEWTTSEEAENSSKENILSYYKLMWINIFAREF